LLTSRVGSKDVEDLCLMTGHIGIYVSSKTQREFTPKIISWLAARDQESSDKTPKNTRSSRKTERTDPSNAKKEINKT
jgi:polyhydroxyalkanoate synthase